MIPPSHQELEAPQANAVHTEAFAPSSPRATAIRRFPAALAGAGVALLFAFAACGGPSSPRSPQPGDRSGLGGSGGGGDEAPTPLYQSGSRLKRRVQEVGGVTTTIGWYDTELETPCEIVAASESSTSGVCVPTHVTEQVGVWEGIPYIRFLDATCTLPVLMVRTCASEPTFFTEFDDQACRRLARATYEVGDELTLTKDTLYRREPDGACSPRPLSAETKALELEEVPVASLVEVDLAVERRDERLDAEVFRSADGAAGIVRLLEHASGVACEVFELEDDEPGLRRCLPNNYMRSLQHIFSDSSCQTRAAVNIEGACGETPSPWAVADVPRDVCTWSETRRLYARGEELEGPIYYAEDGVCGEPVSSPHDSYGLGSPASPSELIPLPEHVDSQELVERRVWVDDNGAAVAEDPEVSLVQYDGPCRIVLTGPARTPRCLPPQHTLFNPDSSLGAPYKDAACTERLTIKTYECKPAGFDYFNRREEGLCGRFHVDDIFRVGDPYEGDVYVVDDNGTCVPFAGNGSLRFYEREPADFDEFPEVTYRIE